MACPSHSPGNRGRQFIAASCTIAQNASIWALCFGDGLLSSIHWSIEHWTTYCKIGCYRQDRFAAGNYFSVGTMFPCTAGANRKCFVASPNGSSAGDPKEQRIKLASARRPRCRIRCLRLAEVFTVPCESTSVSGRPTEMTVKILLLSGMIP